MLHVDWHKGEWERKGERKREEMIETNKNKIYKSIGMSGMKTVHIKSSTKASDLYAISLS